MTGGRVARAAKYLAEDDETFFLTYGDSVTDLNIPDLLRHHLASGKLATITAIHPAARFGEMTLRGRSACGPDMQSIAGGAGCGVVPRYGIYQRRLHGAQP